MTQLTLLSRLGLLHLSAINETTAGDLITDINAGDVRPWKYNIVNIILPWSGIQGITSIYQSMS